jgi:hypothetical protein
MAKLSVIGAASTHPKPPRKLGEPGTSLWNRVQSEFRIDDCGGLGTRAGRAFSSPTRCSTSISECEQELVRQRAFEAALAEREDKTKSRHEANV